MAKKKKWTQLGILPELTTSGIKDYAHTNSHRLNQLALGLVKASGAKGLTAEEATQKDAWRAAGYIMETHTVDSMATRLNELSLTDKIRRTEARRNGFMVFVAIQAGS